MRTRTDGSDSGCKPSKDGDQGPPMAKVSFFPLVPTKNWMARVGWTRLSLFVAPGKKGIIIFVKPIPIIHI